MSFAHSPWRPFAIESSSGDASKRIITAAKKFTRQKILLEMVPWPVTLRNDMEEITKRTPMKNTLLSIAIAIVVILPRFATATQADDTTITITGQSAGVTPFIAQLTLDASDTSVINSIRFTITPKSGSVTRPLSANYYYSYLVDRGYLVPPSNEIFLPVYGLYDNFTNIVTLTYYFNDGSSKSDNTTVTTAIYDDTCGFKTPTVLQARTDSTALSYDYFLVKENCSTYAPAILDTDGAIRWVGPPGNVPPYDDAFFNNAIYRSEATSLYRVDLDGTVTLLHDYTDLSVANFHHNIDPGKVGLLAEVDTDVNGPLGTAQVEATVIEVDSAGNLVNFWNMGDIISAAMIAGGDDPAQFVFPVSANPNDWFHNNAAFYNRADDSVIVSSRENFVIALDYETKAIKWILGDPTKAWYQFPSLQKYALALAPGSLPPIGEHAVSITFDQNLLLFDNGFQSATHVPPGDNRTYASPRKYRLDLTNKLATEVWNFEMGQSILDPICSSVYEDAPYNYLVDYAFVNGFNAQVNYAQFLGLDATGKEVFYYQYPGVFCNQAFNSVPLHLEKTKFPAVGPQALNLSTRGNIGTGDDVLIGGFIVTGNEDKTIALRVLGPSLSDSGIAAPLADPVLTVYDSSGAVIATNDDWASDANSSQITAAGLAPTNSAEAALVTTLPPATYTVIAAGKNGSSGIALVEAYDLSPAAGSKISNISTRGFVGTGENVLISGFIVGDVANATLIIRALGPSLPSTLSPVLADPSITIYDSNGSALAGNDNWQDDVNAAAIQQNGLAPGAETESATVLHPPPGAYSLIVNGANGESGISLVEVYDLD